MWSNNRGGVDEVSKRLDPFMIYHSLILETREYRSWVGLVCCSHPFPVFLELGHVEVKLGAPFKYNSSWAKVEHFRTLIRDNWTHFREDQNSFASSQFVLALHTLKLKVASWAFGHLSTGKKKFL
jgi:hypothetical protein